jgi:hypothetical protein
VPTVLKSGSLNVLEISRPVQGGNGIALPLLLPVPFIVVKIVRRNIWKKISILAESTTNGRTLKMKEQISDLENHYVIVALI